MLDARKAFDRVNFGILFSLLLQSNLPLATVRLLFDSYSQHQTCTVCDRQTTFVFNMSNRVKQRGVTSPIIFKSGIGCHLHGKYMGILGYADNVPLLCFSIRGLQGMLFTCEELEFDIRFNNRNSMCIKHGEKNDSEKAKLTKETIIRVNSVKHLCNIINNELNNLTHSGLRVLWSFKNVNKTST